MKNIHKKLKCFGILLTLTNLSFFSVLGQIQEANSLTPMSPEAANLGKYAMHPPSYSNGQPSLSIPLYTIKENGIEYPISLFYSYSGFKIREEAPSVGLGWVLSEASVTRLIKHLPDDNPHIHTKFDDLNYYDLYDDLILSQGWADLVDGVHTGDSKIYNITANRIFRSYTDGKPDVYRPAGQS